MWHFSFLKSNVEYAALAVCKMFVEDTMLTMALAAMGLQYHSQPWFRWLLQRFRRVVWW